MSKRLLDYDPFTGITQYFEYNDMTKETTISSFQDVTPALDLNRKRQNDTQYTREGVKKEWLHLAYIPPIIIHKWIAEKGVDIFKKEYMPAVCSLLNHPDYKYLKTTEMKHLTKEKFGRVWNIGSNKGSRVHA